jgi:hypothetical protein
MSYSRQRRIHPRLHITERLEMASNQHQRRATTNKPLKTAERLTSDTLSQTQLCDGTVHERESDTNRSLKEVMAELKQGDAPDSVFDSVELLLWKYATLIRQGIRQDIGSHKGVSWYVVDAPEARVYISYQDGPRAEWNNDCYVDELPLWLLLSLFRRIQRRKPLGDQKTDETIQAVDNLNAGYKQLKQERGTLKLSVIPHGYGGTL